MAEIQMCGEIAGVALVQPEVWADDRGQFVETYRRSWFPDCPDMVQSNRADRVANSLVGLHYHRYQADYWYLVAGHARVVLHDLRPGSPTDGATFTCDLGEVDGAPNNHLGLYVPPGVAHGFAACTPVTITYLVDRYYDPSDELGVAWDDPAIGADWVIEHPVLSERDRANPTRDALAAAALPFAYQAG